MLRTITIGSCVSAQGIFVKDLPGGIILVRVYDSLIAGMPVIKKN